MNPTTGSTLSPISSGLLDAVASGNVRHGFFGRTGGVSTGPLYDGLNVGLGSDDRPEDVAENRARVAGWFGVGVERLATLHQVHSPDVIVISGEPTGDRPRADGHVTDRPGIVLGVLSADCGPVLFADAQAGIIGAAHAGWKGALEGVLENTIEAMIGLGARRERIAACLGPSISRGAYEVGPEFVDSFIARDRQWSRHFTPSARSGHSMFDLPGLTIERLGKAGIRAEFLDICTYGDEANFYSYRRTTHRREPDYGRQISAIMLREK